MANHRVHETGKQRYQQVISTIGSLLSVKSLFSPVKLQNCRLLASHIIHVLPKRVPHYMCMWYSYTISYVRLLSKLTPSSWLSVRGGVINSRFSLTLKQLVYPSSIYSLYYCASSLHSLSLKVLVATTKYS